MERPSVRISIYPNPHDQTGDTLVVRGTWRQGDKIIIEDIPLRKSISLENARQLMLKALSESIGTALVQVVWEQSRD